MMFEFDEDEIRKYRSEMMLHALEVPKPANFTVEFQVGGIQGMLLAATAWHAAYHRMPEDPDAGFELAEKLFNVMEDHAEQWRQNWEERN